jgi:hypothetical protein
VATGLVRAAGPNALLWLPHATCLPSTPIPRPALSHRADSPHSRRSRLAAKPPRPLHQWAHHRIPRMMCTL